ESMQAGLSWALILRKRETLRSCFANFSPEKLAAFTEEDIERIMHTENMIKSERKIRAMIQNAKAFLALQKEEGSFDTYLWSFSGGKSLCYQGHEKGEMPAKNALSEAISKDLKKRGFQYTGPVIVYSFLQACGVINDHEEDCPCYQALRKAYPYQEVEETFSC
ncbi:DNA-3-methyladenine glycosylase I, partial [Oribacterium sinus]